MLSRLMNSEQAGAAREMNWTMFTRPAPRVLLRDGYAFLPRRMSSSCMAEERISRYEQTPLTRIDIGAYTPVRRCMRRDGTALLGVG